MRQFGGPDPAQMQKALEMYQAAGNDQDKEKARKSLAEMLSQYFEADMKQRESEIEAIEARVQKLRAQLNKRAEAQGEIVDLQLKVLINQADGLGFYSQQGANSDDLFSTGTRGGSEPKHQYFYYGSSNSQVDSRRSAPTVGSSSDPQNNQTVPSRSTRRSRDDEPDDAPTTESELTPEESETTAPAEEAAAEKTPAASVETPAQESSKPTPERETN